LPPPPAALDGPLDDAHQLVDDDRDVLRRAEEVKAKIVLDFLRDNPGDVLGKLRPAAPPVPGPFGMGPPPLGFGLDHGLAGMNLGPPMPPGPPPPQKPPGEGWVSVKPARLKTAPRRPAVGDPPLPPPPMVRALRSGDRHV
jgi:hypothetical protein